MCNAQRRREALLHPISLVRVPQGIDPPTAHTIFEVSWLCSNKQRSHPDFEGLPKGGDPHATHETKPHQDRSGQFNTSRSNCCRRTGVRQLLRTDRLCHRRIHKGQLRRRERPILRHRNRHGLRRSHRSTIKRTARAELLYFSRPRDNKVRQPSTSLRGHSLLLSGRRSSDWKQLRSSPLLQLTRAHPEAFT